MEDFNNEIETCLKVLNEGGIILYPTDTIWGIGCDASNEEAVKKIYDLKQRADSKSMLVLLDRIAKIQNFVSELPEIAWDLIELSEKPLTIIYDGARHLAPNLIGEDGSIGIRITNERFTQKLIQRFKKPLVSTSANTSGSPSPANFMEVQEEIISGVDYVVNYRQNDFTEASPSGIIKLGADCSIKVIRK